MGGKEKKREKEKMSRQGGGGAKKGHKTNLNKCQKENTQIKRGGG